MQPKQFTHDFTKSKLNKLGYSNQTKTTKLVKPGETESWFKLNILLVIDRSILQGKNLVYV